MNKRFIHTDFLDNLSGFFPDTCSIEEFTTVSGDYNEPEKSWSDKYTDVPCAIGESDGRGVIEQKQDDKTVSRTTYRIVLKGAYDVTTSDRVKVGSDYYDILLEPEDSRGVKTSIICEKITI